MQISRQITELRRKVHRWHMAGESCVLVPTMGNLHAGHLALVKKARTLGDRVLVTIFVNPSQFVAGEDFDDYPRTLERDSELLRSEGVDVLFAPKSSEIYPNGHEQEVQVRVPSLENIYCGASRPGHFAGVATIVSKLFHITQADIAIFGEKDFQQLLVIKKLVADLNMPIKIESLATVREADGLAMSSRNQYLSENERKTAVELQASLQEMAKKLLSGEKNYNELENHARQRLQACGFDVDYISICNQKDLSKPTDSKLIVLAAARLGKARLIDNIIVNLG